MIDQWPGVKREPKDKRIRNGGGELLGVRASSQSDG